MNYRIINHSSYTFLLKNVVKIYELTTSNEECYYRTIPNGIIGFSLKLKGKSWFFENEKWHVIPKSTINGLTQKPLLIKESKDCREISFGFNPLFLSLFLKHPMHLVSDKTTDLREIMNVHIVEELEENLFFAKDDNTILSCIEKFLLQTLCRTVDFQLLEAYNCILTNQTTKVERLAQYLNVSTRTLLNRFKDQVGLSPKDLMKIHRINNSLNIKLHNPENLTDLAYKLGYFDQSHFIHDFKGTIGISPEKYFTNNLLISDFYNLDRWSVV